MSEANRDLLARAVAAYNAGDVEALVRELDPEVQWIPAVPGSFGEEPPVYSGHEGIAQMFHDFYEILDEIHFEYTEVREHGDLVIAIGEIRIRGKASGVETVSPYANVAEVHDGKGMHLRGYLDIDEALAAAGLSL